MAFIPITTAQIALKKLISSISFWTQIKDNFDYLYGAVSEIPPCHGIPNGSLEMDSDSDGVPDFFTKSLYPGGSGGFYTTTTSHGAKAYYFTHPGGVSNGGGYLETDYIPCTNISYYNVQFAVWGTSGPHALVEARYYDKSKVYISAESPFSSSALNPTPTIGCYTLTIPANTRYLKLRFHGGYPDVNYVGTVYWDDLCLTRVMATP